MIRIYKALLGTVLLGMLSFSPRTLFGAPKNFQSLLQERRVNLWVEGEALGDLMIGSRGQMEFIYVDKPLIDRARKEGWGTVPDWFRKECQHFGSPELKAKDLFVVRYKALLPWDFSPEELRFGGVSRDLEGCSHPTRPSFSSARSPREPGGRFAVGIPKRASKSLIIAYGIMTFPLHFRGGKEYGKACLSLRCLRPHF